MVFEEIIRYSPRRRASPWLAEGFSPTARNADRIYFAISISPHKRRHAPRHKAHTGLILNLHQAMR